MLKLDECLSSEQESRVFRLLTFLWDVTRCRLVVSDVSGQPINPSSSSPKRTLDGLTLGDGTDRLSRNSGN